MTLYQIDEEIQQVKIAVVGDSGVGKTSLIKRICDKLLPNKSVPTVGVEFSSTTIVIRNQKVLINVWDTCNPLETQLDKRIHPQQQRYFRKANAAILVYDVNSKKSFLDCPHWLTEILENSPQGVSILLLGNKVDRCQFKTESLEELQQFQDNIRQVDTSEAIKFASDNNLWFEEVSALTGFKVSKIMHKFLEKVTSKLVLQDEPPHNLLESSLTHSPKDPCCKC